VRGSGRRRDRSGPPTTGTVREALDTLVELGPGRLDDAHVTAAATLRAQVEERLGRGEGLTVAALAGGTGVGKSALLNALLGREVAVEGVRRPTTSVSLAVAAEQDGPTTALLDWLEVPERHAVGEALPAGAVLLDLPDHDSVVESHRRTAVRLAQRVDVVVWVLDPVKYARADAHAGPLADLTEHADVLVVVLNRCDELPSVEVEVVLADLRARLAAGGHRDARVLATSATTGAGVGELRGLLASIATERAAAVARLTGDAVLLGRRVGAGLEPLPETSVDATSWVPELLEAVDGNRAIADAARAARRDVERRARSPLARIATAPLRKVVGAFVGASVPAASSPLPTRAHVATRVESVATRHLGVLDAVGRTHGSLDAAVVAASDAAAPELLDAVAGAGLAPPRRRWPVALAVLRGLAEVTALVGAGWLTALAVVAWLQLPPLPTPDAIGAVPWPTALLVGGVAVRILLGVLTRGLARVSARRHGARVSRRVRDAVRRVAEDGLLAPVRAELAAQRRLRAAIATLARSGAQRGAPERPGARGRQGASG
jgi:GTP-binding protein EngB required for normal cell division